MHKNRLIYSLTQYQNILIDRWQHTLFWFAKQTENDRYQMFFAKPTPRTPWLPGKPRKKYYKKIENKLNHQLAQHDNYTFLTLTYNTSLYSRDRAFSLLKYHIREFFRLLRKKYPGIQYFWVIELTRQNYPHIHIMLDRFAFWKVISAIWKRITGNLIINIKKIPGSGAARYMAKYVSKQSKHQARQFCIIFKKIDRLYGYSGSFFTATQKQKSEWIFLTVSCECFYSDQYLLRDDDHDFWYIPTALSAAFITRNIVDHCPIHWERVPDDVYDYFHYYNSDFVNDRIEDEYLQFCHVAENNGFDRYEPYPEPFYEPAPF